MKLTDATFTNPIQSPTNLTADAPGAERFISIILQFLTVVGGLWFLFWVIISGYNWITSEGKPDKLETARNQLIQAIIGLIIIIAAYSLTALIGNILLPAGKSFFDLTDLFP